MSKDYNVLQADSEEVVEEVAEVEESTLAEAPKEEPETEAKVEKEAPAPTKKEEKAAPAEGEKKAKKKEEKEEEEEKVLDEKVVTLSLKHANLAYSRKPTPRSVRLLKKKAGKIFNSEDVKIDQRLNSILWSRGKTKSVRRVEVKVQKLEGGTVRVLPATE